jgi:hypothetical protein
MDFCTTNPTGAWVTQQARNLSFTGLFERMRFLIHDREYSACSTAYSRHAQRSEKVAEPGSERRRAP